MMTKVDAKSLLDITQEVKDLIEAKRRSMDSSYNVVQSSSSPSVSSSAPLAIATSLTLAGVQPSTSFQVPAVTTTPVPPPQVSSTLALPQPVSFSNKGTGNGKRTANGASWSSVQIASISANQNHQTHSAKRPRVNLSEAFSEELLPNTRTAIDSKHVLLRFREKYPNVPLVELEDKALTTTLSRNSNIVAIENELAALNKR